MKYEPEVSLPEPEGIVNLSELAPEARCVPSSAGVVALGRMPELLP